MFDHILITVSTHTLPLIFLAFLPPEPFFGLLSWLSYLVRLEAATGRVLQIKVFLEIHRKTPVLESLFLFFIKKRLQHRCFPVNFEKCLRTPVL